MEFRFCPTCATPLVDRVVADDDSQPAGAAARVRQRRLRGRIEHASQIGTLEIFLAVVGAAGNLNGPQAETAEAHNQA